MLGRVRSVLCRKWKLPPAAAAVRSRESPQFALRKRSHFFSRRPLSAFSLCWLVYEKSTAVRTNPNSPWNDSAGKESCSNPSSFRVMACGASHHTVLIPWSLAVNEKRCLFALTALFSRCTRPNLALSRRWNTRLDSLLRSFGCSADEVSETIVLAATFSISKHRRRQAHQHLGEVPSQANESWLGSHHVEELIEWKESHLSRPWCGWWEDRGAMRWSPVSHRSLKGNKGSALQEEHRTRLL